MIRSFANEDTEAIFEGRSVSGFPARIQDGALMKLQLLNAAMTLDDLAAVPSNKLSLLDEGDRAGKYCICINEHGRICFRWDDGNAYDVEIFGYH